MAYFEKVVEYADEDINLPTRATIHSAGYDFEVAKDIVVPAYAELMKYIDSLISAAPEDQRPKENQVFPLDEIKDFMSTTNVKPTLVPTGVKCKLAEDEYLELSLRSSAPLKYWLILANGVGIIDSDYYSNNTNDGEIFFQLINLSPFNIILHKGDKIGQGIIHKYIVTDDDDAQGARDGGFGSTSE